MLVVSSPRFADHLTPPGHPESPERADVLEAVAARAEGARRRGGRRRGRRHATRCCACTRRRTSTPSRPRAGTRRMIDADTFTSPDTAEVALLAAGAAVQAVEAVLAPGDRHASRGGRAGAAARATTPSRRARWASASTTTSPSPRRTPGRAALSRVAVVDYDVHHGNGTQEMFYADPSVLYISTHQFPFYPGTGAATETGERDGPGFTVNVPHRGGRHRRRLRARCSSSVVLPVLEEFSAGPAARSRQASTRTRRDPLAQMRMTSAGFAWMTAELRAMADRVSEGRVVLVTEGGYALPALGESLDLALGALAGDADVPAAAALRPATGRGDRALAAAARRPGGPVAWSIIFDVAEYRPQELDRKWQQRWADTRAFEADRRPDQAEVLLPRDVRLPVRARARRPRPQLHHRRRDGPHAPHARASTCCTRSGGTPSACRPRTPRSRAASIPRSRRSATSST